MVQTEFSAALRQVASERGIDPEDVLETVRVALISAYRKDFGGDIEELSAQVNAETGEVNIFQEGKDVTPPGFGRIAAQTAKQVVLQRIRESEKKALIEEYRARLGTIVSGHIFRVEKGLAIIDLGKTQAIMPPSEQIPGEIYDIGERIRVLVAEIREGARGPEVVVSRSRSEFVAALFALEVPEIANGVVKVEAVAREAGERTKVAVSSRQENVDPVGSCVGQKGVRVQAVIAELGSEKIDIIHFSDDSERFVANSLSPAKVIDVRADQKKKQAKVQVFDDQLSLAIGKGGQNVRLAAKLTGWRIDISGSGSAAKKKIGLSKRVDKILAASGIGDLETLRKASEEELAKIKGLGPKAQEEIKAVLET